MVLDGIALRNERCDLASCIDFWSRTDSDVDLKINLYILFKMEITVHNDSVAVITSPVSIAISN